jgi:hypothetical protein
MLTGHWLFQWLGKKFATQDIPAWAADSAKGTEKTTMGNKYRREMTCAGGVLYQLAGSK